MVGEIAGAANGGRGALVGREGGVESGGLG